MRRQFRLVILALVAAGAVAFISGGEIGRADTRLHTSPQETDVSPDKTTPSRRNFIFMSCAAVALAGAETAIAQPEQKSQKARLGGMPNTIRSVGNVMDELQRDLMQEQWDLVAAYPSQLRSFVPVFTKFTDSAFPTDEPTDKGLRVALRYEVGRFFASVERLRQATLRKDLDDAYIAYSDMALHFDRYMQVGGLYTYYDNIISNEKYFKGIKPSSLVYADPKRDPPDVRDLIILVKGPDMGRTGIMIGKTTDGSNNVYVKLDRFKGMRPIRVVSKAWVGKRLGEQDPDDVFLIPRKANNPKA
jgi:hypothetical protein